MKDEHAAEMEKTHARYMTALDSLRSEHESLHREAITGHTNHLNSLKMKHKRTRTLRLVPCA
jgi:hypothetical protein